MMMQIWTTNSKKIPNMLRESNKRTKGKRDRQIKEEMIDNTNKRDLAIEDKNHNNNNRLQLNM